MKCFLLGKLFMERESRRSWPGGGQLPYLLGPWAGLGWPCNASSMFHKNPNSSSNCLSLCLSLVFVALRQHKFSRPTERESGVTA